MRRTLFVLLLAAVPAFAESIYVTTEVCREEPPETRYGVPTCAEYELHNALIAAMEMGDVSALAFLERRYERTETDSEKFRLAEVLLRRASNDAAIWADVFTEAKLAVRFAAVSGSFTDEFVEWCEEREFEVYEHSLVHDRALEVAARDPRSRDLLVQALESTEQNVVFIAFAGLAHQRDVASLPALERTLEHLPDFAEYLAQTLALFESDQANAIRKKYVHEEEEAEAEAEEEDEEEEQL